jgi:4-amino-4-deoxy-L-arabinose transferase-like glycosyltransferase
MTVYSDVKSVSLKDFVPSAVWTRNDWGIWLALMVVAATLRIVFYTGYFGSDEVTYIESAFKMLQGDWSVSQYVGSNRYGVNLPIAAFAYLFGQNEFSANLYSFLCSLGEIALVFYFGRLMLGLRVAVLATMVLIVLPLHVHFAGRIRADSPLALMITASFLFFWNGERRGNKISFLIAGLVAGLSFWVKQATIIYLILFIFYPIVFQRWNWKWIWMLVGFSLAVASNMVLFWELTGTPFYLFQAVESRWGSSFPEVGSFKQSPIYYLVYLFSKIWHTWLAAYLAVVAVGIWLVRRRNLSQPENDSLQFIILWAGGMLTIFSLLVVSWNPLIFIPKETNYMLMFVAPLALLAGYALAHFRGVIFWVAIGVVVLPSTILAGMEQNAIHVFTANSKAAVKFANENTNADVFGNTNAYRAANFYNLVNPQASKVKMEFVGELFKENVSKEATQQVKFPKYIIMDTETLLWGSGEPVRDINQVPSCWVQIDILKPSEFGLGWEILNTIRVIGQFLPTAVREKITKNLDKLIQPKPAYVYRVTELDCSGLQIPITVNSK